MDRLHGQALVSVLLLLHHCLILAAGSGAPITDRTGSYCPYFCHDLQDCGAGNETQPVEVLQLCHGSQTFCCGPSFGCCSFTQHYIKVIVCGVVAALALLICIVLGCILFHSCQNRARRPQPCLGLRPVLMQQDIASDPHSVPAPHPPSYAEESGHPVKPGPPDAAQYPQAHGDPLPSGYPPEASAYPQAQGETQTSTPGYPQISTAGYTQTSTSGFPDTSVSGYPQTSAHRYPQTSTSGYPHTSAPGYPQTSMDSIEHLHMETLRHVHMDSLQHLHLDTRKHKHPKACKNPVKTCLSASCPHEHAPPSPGHRADSASPAAMWPASSPGDAAVHVPELQASVQYCNPDVCCPNFEVQGASSCCHLHENAPDPPIDPSRKSPSVGCPMKGSLSHDVWKGSFAVSSSQDSCTICPSGGHIQIHQKSPEQTLTSSAVCHRSSLCLPAQHHFPGHAAEQILPNFPLFPQRHVAHNTAPARPPVFLVGCQTFTAGSRSAPSSPMLGRRQGQVFPMGCPSSDRSRERCPVPEPFSSLLPSAPPSPCPFQDFPVQSSEKLCLGSPSSLLDCAKYTSLPPCAAGYASPPPATEVYLSAPLGNECYASPSQGGMGYGSPPQVGTGYASPTQGGTGYASPPKGGTGYGSPPLHRASLHRQI